jgi:hypothetical protein
MISVGMQPPASVRPQTRIILAMPHQQTEPYTDYIAQEDYL